MKLWSNFEILNKLPLIFLAYFYRNSRNLLHKYSEVFRKKVVLKALALVSVFIKKDHWYRCFHVNYLKFSRTPFLLNTSGPLLLAISAPFLWLLMHHFIMMLETWMLIQCSTEFHFWTIAKYISDWICFKHIICFVTISVSLGISCNPIY